jgi:hypothetical protein
VSAVSSYFLDGLPDFKGNFSNPPVRAKPSAEPRIAWTQSEGPGSPQNQTTGNPYAHGRALVSPDSLHGKGIDLDFKLIFKRILYAEIIFPAFGMLKNVLRAFV